MQRNAQKEKVKREKATYDLGAGPDEKWIKF